MTFIQPLFLWGLLGLLIPIVIHLFYFRKHKKVYFSDVRYLKEIKEERSTIERLKHLLILASRLLAIAFIVLAFAQPVKNEKEIINNTADIGIYIDNSKSMLLEGEGGNALTKAKKNALEIINSFGDLNRFLIFENGESYSSTTWLTKDQAREQVKGITESNQAKSFNDIESVAKNFFDTDKRSGKFYWISDCQENIVSAPEDSTIDHQLWPILHNNVDNIFIDTMFLLAPVQSSKKVNRIVVKLVNDGTSQENDVRLSLELDGVPKSSKSINLDKQSEKFDTLQFTVKNDGWKDIKVEVYDNNVKYDNALFGSFYLQNQKKVLEIGNVKNKNAFVSSTFQASDFTAYTFQDVLKVQYSELWKYDLIVLNGLLSIPDGLVQSLQSYLKGGGNLTVIPGITTNFKGLSRSLEQLGVDGFSNLLKQITEVNQLNLNEQVLREVLTSVPRNMLFPSVQKYYVLNQRYRSNKKTILATANRKDILAKYAVGSGIVYLFTTDVNNNNSGLAQHYIFAPIMFNMAYEALNDDQLYYSIGHNMSMELNSLDLGSDDVLTVKAKDHEFFPRQTKIENRIRLNIDPDLVSAGHYQIIDKDKVVSHFSVNDDRLESTLKFLSLEKIKTQFPGFNLMVDERNQPIADFSAVRSAGNGWKICLIFALLFLAIEAILIRIFT